MKRTLGSMKQDAERDRLACVYDRALYQVDPNRWDGSEAQKLLKQDVDNDLHKFFETPKRLWLSRTEYHTKFDLAEFRPHVHQEI